MIVTVTCITGELKKWLMPLVTVDLNFDKLWQLIIK